MGFAVRNKHRYDRSKFERAVELIDQELEGIQKEKEFMISEGKIRELIRTQIQIQLGKKNTTGEDFEGGVPFRLHGTDQDAKLERQIPKSVVHKNDEPQAAETILGTTGKERLEEIIGASNVEDKNLF